MSETTVDASNKFLSTEMVEILKQISDVMEEHSDRTERTYPRDEIDPIFERVALLFIQFTNIKNMEIQ